MVFVHDAPPSIQLAKSHREAEVELNFIAAAEIGTVPDRGCERDFVAGGYFYIAKGELNGLGLAGKERLPRRHVRVQPTRQERRRYIEHQDVGIMIGTECCQVFVAHGL